MNINIVGKNMTVTEGMREHISEKLSRYEKLAPRLVDTHVVLKKQKYLFEAEITLFGKNLRAFGDGKSKENVFIAIDLAYGRVAKQLKRFLEKRKDHHKEAARSRKLKGFSEAPELAKDAEEFRVQGNRPRIVPSNKVPARPMFPDDASHKLENSAESFLVFQNASTKQINVIYKREDGNHGLIEPKL